MKCLAFRIRGKKAAATPDLVSAWKDATLVLGNQLPPDRPGRASSCHYHIELNAVDLALHMASRFTKTQLPLDFYHDLLDIADDEARHFFMFNNRLANLSSVYGNLPAHDGPWQAADATKHNLPACLAIAPLALETYGLDVTPTMIDRLKSVGYKETANALGIIMADEITHL